MQDENNIEENTPLTQDPPDLTPKAGWKTSEGQIVAFLGVVFTILSFVGYHFTPEQTQSVYDIVHSVFVILGPFMVYVPILWAYIVSRGKQKSNAINATAAMNLGGLGSILGGKNWKDPSRYINILKDVAATGIIPGPAGKVIDQVTGGGDDDFKEQVVKALESFDERLKKLEGK